MLACLAENAPLWKSGKMPCNSSTLVTRLLDAHGVVLGKTRMHELAEGVTSINVYGGPVLNPYNNTMHVGGALLPEMPKGCALPR